MGTGDLPLEMRQIARGLAKTRCPFHLGGAPMAFQLWGEFPGLRPLYLPGRDEETHPFSGVAKAWPEVKGCGE